MVVSNLLKRFQFDELDTVTQKNIGALGATEEFNCRR